MLLTVDVGNTNITLGLFEGKDIHSELPLRRLEHQMNLVH